jgi:similar to stage IV sporulation protein
LNLALKASINLWDIERSGPVLRASISLGDFFWLRPVARGARSRVRISLRRGLPFRVRTLKGRPALLAGALLCAAFLLWGSSHIWVVNVKITGPQNLDPRAVSAIAAEAGLKFGAPKYRVDVRAVQRHIERQMGEVSWAVIRIQGTRAVIEVVEKAAHRPSDQMGCVNLVARKDGVVERVIPFQGEPMVKKGDTVRAGDLLMECSFRYWPGGRPAVFPGMPLPPRDGIARTLVAQAMIKARIPYQESHEVPLYQEIPVPTGRKATQWVLKLNGKPILVWGAREFPFAHHQEDRQSYSLGSWRNWQSPVELVKLTAEEVQVRREPITPAEALAQAKEQMAARLRWVMGPADKMLSPIRAEVAARGRDSLIVRVTAETLEEIAVPHEGSPPVEQPTPDRP